MKQIGWIMVFGVAVLQSLAGVMLLFGDPITTFEGDTGVSWVELSSNYPTVGAQFMIASQSAQSSAAAVSLFSALVCFFGLRTGQKWAWFTMWLMPLSILPGIIGLLGTDNQQVFGYAGLVFVAITVVGLLLSIPAIFSGKTQPQA